VPNSIYDDLPQRPANFESLSPLSFLRRSATLYPTETSVIHGPETYTWAETYARCCRLASALAARGIGRGDTVAAMLPNTPAMFEAHFAIAMIGGVLNAINTRLDTKTISFIFGHGEARLLLTDAEFAGVVGPALSDHPLMTVVDVEDGAVPAQRLGSLTYAELLDEGDPSFDWQMPDDEWHAISLNYTSGTTGDPKGVVYHHRGAYLNAVNNAVSWGMGLHPRYLWTLPMFHCNGWCFPWTLAALAGTTICLRQVREEAIFDAIRTYKVTHFCGAPVVLNALINAPDEMKHGIDHEISVMTAGAAPPAAVIQGMEELGFDVTQVYGLTETYGPMVVSAWKHVWDDLPISERSALKSRQGIPSIMAEDLMVADPETLEPVPWDGETQGEIFMRGNITMKGYLKNQPTTDAAFAGDWFHSGDIAVRHPDGYVQIKDRSKDVIISGGENISSIEIEDVLFRHPAILEAAVVARADDKWGEHPCAFVTLKPGHELSADVVIEHCRAELARFKVPRTVVFSDLPKTSTGKVQKFVLRTRADAI
jgi:fatty-acyl-CoA synthase